MEDFIFRKRQRSISTETLFESLEDSDDDISYNLCNKINELNIDNKNIELFNIINEKINRIDNKIKNAIKDQIDENIKLKNKIDKLEYILNKFIKDKDIIIDNINYDMEKIKDDIEKIKDNILI